MAIDKDKTRNFIKEVEALISELIPENYRDTVMNMLMGPALNELKELIDESRPPVFYLVGRSGHGKSSLINALVNKKVAEVGHIEPTTAESVYYEIEFQEQNAKWRIVDSRGLFETTSPGGGAPIDTVERVKQDIEKYKPDIIIHVISAPDIRNLEPDLKVFPEIMQKVKDTLGVELPVIVLLTKVDTLDNPEEWPPEKNPTKAKLILDALEYMVKDVLKVEYEYYDKNAQYKGFLLKNKIYIAVIPVCTHWKRRWNIETLLDLIAEKLPKSAILEFIQAQKRKNLLKKISNSLIKKFSSIAAGIGAIPIPVSDIIILTPLQLLLIGIIGGLSCKTVSKETAMEFLAASGITIGAGLVFRAIARQLVKLIPAGGSIISATIAYNGTFAIGKSAEFYFFEGIVKKPEDFKGEAEAER